MRLTPGAGGHVRHLAHDLLTNDYMLAGARLLL